MFLYVIRSYSSDRFYIGITCNMSSRYKTHVWASKNKKSLLYSWMQKYPDWFMEEAVTYETREEAEQDEKFWIAYGRENDWNLLNLAEGGDGGYAIPESQKDEWKAKLSEARQGRQPALGMKHTEENKILFSKVSRGYWDKQDTYNPEKVTAIPFKEAKDKYSISKTHYYRLKRALAND